jgi:hypothetical protein
VAAQADLARLEVLWPHLANQVLLGASVHNGAQYNSIVEQVAALAAV